MCIHNILKNRGAWQHVFYTRQRTYSVLRKFVKIVPTNQRGEFSTAENQADGVVVIVDMERTRLPHGVRRLQSEKRTPRVKKQCITRGRGIRSGASECGAAFK